MFYFIRYVTPNRFFSNEKCDGNNVARKPLHNSTETTETTIRFFRRAYIYLLKLVIERKLKVRVGHKKVHIVGVHGYLDRSGLYRFIHERDLGQLLHIIGIL